MDGFFLCRISAYFDIESSAPGCVGEMHHHHPLHTRDYSPRILLRTSIQYPYRLRARWLPTHMPVRIHNTRQVGSECILLGPLPPLRPQNLRYKNPKRGSSSEALSFFRRRHQAVTDGCSCIHHHIASSHHPPHVVL